MSIIVTMITVINPNNAMEWLAPKTVWLLKKNLVTFFQ